MNKIIKVLLVLLVIVIPILILNGYVVTKRDEQRWLRNLRIGMTKEEVIKTTGERFGKSGGTRRDKNGHLYTSDYWSYEAGRNYKVTTPLQALFALFLIVGTFGRSLPDFLEESETFILFFRDNKLVQLFKWDNENVEQLEEQIRNNEIRIE